MKFNSQESLRRRRQTAISKIEEQMIYYKTNPKETLNGRKIEEPKKFSASRIGALEKEKEVLEERIKFNLPRRKTIKRKPNLFAPKSKKEEKE